VRVRPTIVVAVRRYEPTEEWYGRGLRAMLARGRLNEHAGTAGLKRLGYLDQIVALAEARHAGCEEAVLLDTARHLAEATTSNLFLVVAGELRTPPVTCGILPGITRGAIADIAGRLGIAVREEALWPDAIGRADEAFLTSSLREVVPLVAVDGQRVGAGMPGPLTRRLLDEYRALVGGECRS
jgi:branched-chain amino acid aminotransferase